jgi:F-type H+-transporting ATPase subunit b
MAEASVNAIPAPAPQPGLPQLDVTWYPAQLFWLVLTFGLLFLFFWRVTLPMIEGVLRERRNRIEGDLGTAEKMRQQAADALAGYETEMANARNRAQQVLAENRKTVAGSLDELKSKAEAEMHATIAQAEERVSAERSRALANLRPAAAEAAADIVGRLIGTQVGIDEASGAITELQASP